MTAATEQEVRRVALVTGGSRGIGAATAVALAATGHDLLLTFATRADAAEEVARRCRNLGARVCIVRSDLADPDAIGQAFRYLDAHLGPLDVLVNNAGMLPPTARVADLDPAAAARTMTVNALGPLLCSAEAVRRMSTSTGGGGGVIVNISSRAAVRGAAGEFVHYAMSKAAIDVLTVGLAQEVAREGIRVVGVRPGIIDTDMNATVPGRLERLVDTVPMGRIGTAEEVAEAVSWLSSDAARYVTGVTLDVSGGR